MAELGATQSSPGLEPGRCANCGALQCPGGAALKPVPGVRLSSIAERSVKRSTEMGRIGIRGLAAPPIKPPPLLVRVPHENRIN